MWHRFHLLSRVIFPGKEENIRNTGYLACKARDILDTIQSIKLFLKPSCLWFINYGTKSYCKLFFVLLVISKHQKITLEKEGCYTYNIHSNLPCFEVRCSLPLPSSAADVLREQTRFGILIQNYSGASFPYYPLRDC